MLENLLSKKFIIFLTETQSVGFYIFMDDSIQYPAYRGAFSFP